MPGSEYASCCNAVEQQKSLLYDGPFGHFQHPDLFITTSTLIPGIKWSAKESACTHIVWGVPIKNATATSITWVRNYSATATSRYTSFPCWIEGDDCDQMYTTYAANLESWSVKYDHQPMNEAMARERARIMAPSCVRKVPQCNDGCVIHASSADLYFFRPASRRVNMCNGSPTGLPHPYTAENCKLARPSEDG
jgi:hypothetical protein